jgi:transposase
MARREELTDGQWILIKPLIPEPLRRADGRGRPWRDAREVLNGILWILRSGARWQDLPARFPSYQTCHRRFQQWVRDGTLQGVLEALARDLRDRGDLDLSECFIDGTFVVAKKGAREWERPSGGRARSSWRWQTALVFLSPSTRRLLRRMKSPLSPILSLRPLPPSTPNGPTRDGLTLACIHLGNLLLRLGDRPGGVAYLKRGAAIAKVAFAKEFPESAATLSHIEIALGGGAVISRALH